MNGETQRSLRTSLRQRFYYRIACSGWGYPVSRFLWKRSADFRRWWGEAP